MKGPWLLIATLVLATFALLGCNEERAKTTPSEKEAGSVAQESALEHALKHTDPNYLCPMHPQIIRGEPGTCPICGMNLVAVAQASDAGSEKRKVLYYRHPHNPLITSQTPMKDEMGMDYVPVYDDGSGVSVKISPAVEQNMGVRTAGVERKPLHRRIDTVGYVSFDENKVSHVHLRTDGWVEKLRVKSEGERVKRGEVLLDLYSPTLVNAQEEYLQALNSGSKQLIEASKERLIALGISVNQINRLEKNRRVQQTLKIYARQDGIVAALKIREGMYIKPAMEVMTLADLSTIWLLAEVFESQADWVDVGQRAEVRLPYLPGRTWTGRVEYIYPSLNPKTRTLKVRLGFDNRGEELKPNMFAAVTIYGAPTEDTLAIPREALIRTGQEERVILKVAAGRYQPHQVVAGIESGDWIEIKNGLALGDTVVTSGQFLIDSEASLKASVMRMSETSPSSHPMTPSENDAPNTAIIGTGVLKSIRDDQSKVNMAHDPIPALGWPSMTMDLDLAEGINVEGLRPGDSVRFELRLGGQGYIISAIQKAAAQGAQP